MWSCLAKMYNRLTRVLGEVHCALKLSTWAILKADAAWVASANWLSPKILLQQMVFFSPSQDRYLVAWNCLLYQSAIFSIYKGWSMLCTWTWKKFRCFLTKFLDIYRSQLSMLKCMCVGWGEKESITYRESDWVRHIHSGLPLWVISDFLWLSCVKRAACMNLQCISPPPSPYGYVPTTNDCLYWATPSI